MLLASLNSGMGYVNPQISRTDSRTRQGWPRKNIWKRSVFKGWFVCWNLTKFRVLTGQAYVALSRATSLEGLQVLNFDAEKVRKKIIGRNPPLTHKSFRSKPIQRSLSGVVHLKSLINDNYCYHYPPYFKLMFRIWTTWNHYVDDLNQKVFLGMNSTVCRHQNIIYINYACHRLREAFVDQYYSCDAAI